MRKRAVTAITTAFSELSAANRLKVEVDLLTRYSTDVIYRLRYDTMQYDYISPAVTRLLGYTPEELKTLPLRSLIQETRILSEGMRSVESYNDLEENRKRGDVGKWQADYRMKTQSGKTIWVSDISYPWFDKKGAIIGSIGSLRDITERMEAEARIREDALKASTTDDLTSLANRQTFWAALEKETARIKRSQGDLSLLLIEIDHMDRVMEQHGNKVAESLITSVAALIRQCLRGLDLPARLANAEFGVILPETSPEGASRVAARIRDTIARHTFLARSKPLGCTVSLGIAGSRLGHETDAMRLFKTADMRRYIASHTGGNRFSCDEMIEKVH